MPNDLKLQPYEKLGWWNRQKWLWRHQFPLMMTWPVFFVVVPIWTYFQYKRLSDPNSKVYQYMRFKNNYVVLRHDDPEVEKIIKVEKPDPMYTVRYW